MSDKHTHTSDCEWHIDQYPWECTCGAIPKKQAMDNRIAQDADLIDKLRDEDSYYRMQEKHWCIDAEELERQRLAAADRIEALEMQLESANEALREQLDIRETLEAENERLRRDRDDLLTFAKAIQIWRSDADSYDRECDHPQRNYCEDVELMEGCANIVVRRVTARAALGEKQ